ncbi:MAG: ATP-binding protein [Candidatus Competibacterales bacterium]
MTDDPNALMRRFDQLLRRLDAWLPPPPPDPDFAHTTAWRWHPGPVRGWGGAFLQPITHPQGIALADLHGIDRQKALLVRNTRQFIQGLPANNALLWGARGTGKSSLIKALLREFATDGLRLIEVDKDDLMDLATIAQVVRERPERFILYCDDLSFEADDSRYKALKAILDGSLSAAPDNVLLYASSNRRHLLPEYQQDNRDARVEEGELHFGEAVEEKISLSERFGLWLSFHPFRQETYLAIAAHWLAHFGAGMALDERARTEALRYALTRGSRSGRVAQQFARDWVGRRALE